jgi:CheY-like chemotaxis protein
VVDQIGEYPNGIKLRFTVADSGIGMTSEQCKKVFESFQQANYETAIEYGGTGLGLSIARHLVNLMGGELIVKSEIGVGSSFSFELPFTLSNEAIGGAENSTVEKAISKIDGIKVLVAEDNLVNQKFISKVLEKNKADYTLVENGEACLKRSKEKKFDVIILDIHMPKLDGYKTAELIRKSNGPNANSPIVALTASALVTDRKKALDSGMNDYLTKPFTPQQLNKLLAKFFSQTRVNLSIDEAYLLDFYQGDEMFENEMFEIFLRNTPKEIEKLKKFLNQGNIKGVYEIAHKIKPTFKMVGLGQIENKIGKLESLAHVYASEKLITYFQKTEPLIYEAIETVKNHLAEKSRPS